ncbi:MAG: hypothetical protein J2P25_24775, partial [Nocardiopsaceae bacterium]|nr:hypothetical protein [Nocardiopsaceae bacterium]
MTVDPSFPDVNTQITIFSINCDIAVMRVIMSEMKAVGLGSTASAKSLLPERLTGFRWSARGSGCAAGRDAGAVSRCGHGV